LFLAAPEEGEDAVKEQRYETDQGAHGEGILRNFSLGNES
jgi:hypothetical protein